MDARIPTVAAILFLITGGLVLIWLPRLSRMVKVWGAVLVYTLLAALFAQLQLKWEALTFGLVGLALFLILGVMTRRPQVKAKR
jgi:hypothetical protein